jgi:hypothetical protein
MKSMSTSKNTAMNHLLNRRHFLNRTVTGLSSIALTSLLKQDNLLASESPIRRSLIPRDPMHRDRRTLNRRRSRCS